MRHIKHAKSSFDAELSFELRRPKSEPILLGGLTNRLDHIDEVISIIGRAKTADEAQMNLNEEVRSERNSVQSYLSHAAENSSRPKRKK